jgi:hypothetical protein
VVFDGTFDESTTISGATVGTSASVGCRVYKVKQSRDEAIESLVSIVVAVSVVGCTDADGSLDRKKLLGRSEGP